MTDASVLTAHWRDDWQTDDFVLPLSAQPRGPVEDVNLVQWFDSGAPPPGKGQVLSVSLRNCANQINYAIAQLFGQSILLKCLQFFIAQLRILVSNLLINSFCF